MDIGARMASYRARRQGSDTPRRAGTPTRSGSLGRQGGSSYAGGAVTPASSSHFTHERGGLLEAPHNDPYNVSGAAINGYPHTQQSSSVQRGPSHTTAPNDLTTYILELEAQNRELRQHIESLQGQLAAAGGEAAMGLVPSASGPEGRLREVMGEDGAKTVSGAIFGSGKAGGRSVFTTEAEKKAFLTDILAQIEVVIQAHRNKTHAEVSRYKAEAESARESLRSLREIVQREGMDLTLAPGLIAAQRSLGGLGGPAAALAVAGGPAAASLSLIRGDVSDLALTPECEVLLGGISSEMLRRLVALDGSSDLAAAVRDEVRRGFLAVVRHFSQQLVLSAKDAAAALAEQREENERTKAEMRTQLHMSEERRLQMAREHDIVVGALRDELHAFNLASADDDIERNLHQRALEEYNRMLVESRTETSALRRALEDEKNHSAEVCLRLKTALQRRSAEFEKTIVEQAEALVRERDDVIKRLEGDIAVLRGPPKTFVNVACQMGDSCIVPIDSDNYVNNVLKAMRRDPKSVGENSEQYERELWRHTQELIQRYGGVLPQNTSASAQSQHYRQ